MLLDIAFLIAGFVILIKGANWLVEGATNMARRLGVSTLIVGLTVVAFGTSLPELIVSVLAAWRGSSEIALGNVIGSNFANIGLILGISALIMPLAVRSSTVWKEIPLAVASAVLVLLLAFDTHVSEGLRDVLTFRDGLILLIFFVVFLFYVFSLAASKKASFLYREKEFQVPTMEGHMRWPSIILLIVSGIAMVGGGGELVVRHSVEIARVFGWSEAFIGATIIAIGTSLPEFVTSVSAAIRKQPDIAVGNIVGSIIFNALFILGIASLVSPLEIDSALWQDGIFMVAITVLLWVFCGFRHRLNRIEGGVLVAVYLGYLAFILERQSII